MTTTALAAGEPDDRHLSRPGREEDDGIGLSAEREAEIIGESVQQLASHIRALIDYLSVLKSQQRAWRKGAAAERRLGSMLSRLEPQDWHLLADLRWPGTNAANIDLLLIGPPGVFVIDAKDWSQSAITSERLREAAVKVHDQATAVRRLMADRGLAPGVVTPLLIFEDPSPRHPRTVNGVEILSSAEALQRLAALGPRISGSRINELTATIELAVPTCLDISRRGGGDVAGQQLALFDGDAIKRELVNAAERGPVEDWMVWLDPSQAPLITRKFKGPVRIRGASGTGKTVVALHRAHYLAEQFDHSVFFTSFVRSLVRVERELFERLGRPGRGSVEFRSVHSWAGQLLNRRGIQFEVDSRRAQRSFRDAWRDVGQSLSIAGLQVPVEYWWDEIQSVIKGRGLLGLDDYMQLERIGRSVALQPVHRHDVWRLFESYEMNLRDSGCLDWPDVIILAKDEVDREPLQSPYDSVVVDEVQDLSVSALQLLTKIVNPEAPGILLVGDGQQSIYAGSYRLSEAGLDVTGRGTVLKINYRNGRGILDRALEIVQNLAFSDLDSEVASARRKVRAIRPGGTVIEAVERSPRALEARMMGDLLNTLGHGVRSGDCAVLCHTNGEATRWRRALERRGLSALLLDEYQGRTNAAVKVGTYHRAKGLEFVAVFIPDLHTVMKAPRFDESVEAAEERATNEARQLFVACTRARDYLWLGRLSGGVVASSGHD